MAYAELLGKAKKRGYAIDTADALIAAIASTHGMIVATRDVTPFQSLGIGVINPWAGSL